MQQYIGWDIINGSAWVEGIVYQQQDAMFAEMLQESNLLISLYIIMVGVHVFIA